MRKFLVITALLLIAGSITYLMWQEEYRYTLPTPIPENWDPVALNSCIPSESIPGLPFSGTPRVLHFFNPECPCSRFNLKHFEYLRKEYGSQADFQVIIPETASLRRAGRLLPTGTHISVDVQGKLAAACGVYATPQAVIIDETGGLYYRGNYNKARFCTLPGTNYAEISLQMLLEGKAAPEWGPLATIAYGCDLSDPYQDELTAFFRAVLP